MNKGEEVKCVFVLQSIINQECIFINILRIVFYFRKRLFIDDIIINVYDEYDFINNFEIMKERYCFFFRFFCELLYFFRLFELIVFYEFSTIVVIDGYYLEQLVIYLYVLFREKFLFIELKDLLGERGRDLV